MTNSLGGTPKIGLFLDWNNTAGPGGIRNDILDLHGGPGAAAAVKARFDQYWKSQPNHVRAERGAVKRKHRSELLLREQLEGVTPRITVDDMYLWGYQHGHAYPGFLELISHLKDQVASETAGGNEVWVTVVTNAWTPVIWGILDAFEERTKLRPIDQVFGSQFERVVTRDGLEYAAPVTFVGEETKPLAIDQVSRQPDVARTGHPLVRLRGANLAAPSDALVIPAHRRVYWGNGFSDEMAFRYVHATGGINVGVRDSDALHPKEDQPQEQRAQSDKYMAEDRELLARYLDEGMLDAVVDAEYAAGSLRGNRTIATAKRVMRDVLTREPTQVVSRDNSGPDLAIGAL